MAQTYRGYLLTHRLGYGPGTAESLGFNWIISKDGAYIGWAKSLDDGKAIIDSLIDYDCLRRRVGLPGINVEDFQQGRSHGPSNERI